MFCLKGIVYRSAALTLAFVVACSALVVPASATDYQSTYNFWNWAYDNSWFLGKAIIGFSAGNVCQVSEDSMHHATTHSGGGGSVDGQRVYNCVCDLCGVEFQAVATDLEQSYDSYEDTNTVNSSSSGPQPTVSNWFLNPFLFSDNENYKYYSFDYVAPNEYYIDYALLTSGKSMNYAIRCSVFINSDIVSSYTVNLPAGSIFDGTQCSSALYYCYKSVDGELSYLGNVYDSSYSGKSPTYKCEGGVEYVFEYRNPSNLSAEFGVRKTSLHVMERPTVTITRYNQPYTEVYNYLPPSGTTYYNDSSNNSVQNEQPVIDPTGKTIYNPVTNTTTNITNWTYDYSDRSYTCTTENNTTTTITYGDEFITINEGDVNNTYITYNIYYYIRGDALKLLFEFWRAAFQLIEHGAHGSRFFVWQLEDQFLPGHSFR